MINDKIDHNYFEKINTEEKAYWLGFLIADGNISTEAKKSGKSYSRVGICLKESDRNHLLKLKKDLNATTEIILKDTADSRTKSGRNRVVQFRFSSEKIVHDLRVLGINERKTGDEYLPEVAPYLKRHLIRGYIDGDGWIRKTRGLIGFVASNYQVVDYIQSYFKEEVGVEFKVIDESHKYNSGVINCNINKLRDSHLAIYHLYNNASVFLDRKMEVVKEAISLRNYCPPIEESVGNKPCEPVNTGCDLKVANGESPNVEPRVIPCQVTGQLYMQF